jgi:hypothetical protein
MRESSPREAGDPAADRLKETTADWTGFRNKDWTWSPERLSGFVIGPAFGRQK